MEKLCQHIDGTNQSFVMFQFLSFLGYWEPERRLHMYKYGQVVWPSNLNTTPTDRPQSLKNRKFRIVTIEVCIEGYFGS